MFKKTLHTLLFLAIFALLITGLSPIFLPKDNSAEAGIHDDHTVGYLGEPENSLDVLFLGDSEGFCAFIPLYIWESHGITSYICGSGNQILCQSYSYLKDVFQTHNPQIVILETNALYREFTVADYLSHEMQQTIPLLQYHDRWKALRSEDFAQTPNYTNTIRDKGYSFRYGVKPRHIKFQMDPTDESTPVPIINQNFVKKIRDFCTDHDAQLILISAPNPKNWSMYHHNGTAQMAQNLDIPFVDMNLLSQEIPIDLTTDTYDGGEHMNYFGAVKVTSYLSEYLWNMGLFENKRNLPEYASWNLDLEAFQKDVKLAEAGLTLK